MLNRPCKISDRSKIMGASLAVLLHNPNDTRKGVMFDGMRKKVRHQKGCKKESHKKEIRRTYPGRVRNHLPSYST